MLPVIWFSGFIKSQYDIWPFVNFKIVFIDWALLNLDITYPPSVIWRGYSFISFGAFCFGNWLLIFLFLYVSNNYTGRDFVHWHLQYAYYNIYLCVMYTCSFEMHLLGFCLLRFHDCCHPYRRTRHNRQYFICQTVQDIHSEIKNPSRAGKNLGFLEKVFRFFKVFKVFLKVFLGFLDFSIQRQLDKNLRSWKNILDLINHSPCHFVFCKL